MTSEPRQFEEVLVKDCSDDEDDEQDVWTMVPGDLYGASTHPDPGTSPPALGQDVGSENLPRNTFPSPKLVESTSFGKF
jgi:hypothetical protein